MSTNNWIVIAVIGWSAFGVASYFLFKKDKTLSERQRYINENRKKERSEKYNRIMIDFKNKVFTASGDWKVVILSCLLVSLFFFSGSIHNTKQDTVILKPEHYPAPPANSPTNVNIFIPISIVNINSNPRIPKQKDWSVKTIETTDIKGKKLEFRLGVLKDTYRWVKGNNTEIAMDTEETNRIPVEDVIKGFDANYDKPIIVVGAASNEGLQRTEEIRALDRTDKLADICSNYFRNSNIYSFSLGQYIGNDRDTVYSAKERRVILLTILKGEDSETLTDEVRKAFVIANEQLEFSFNAQNYSLFKSFSVSRRRIFSNITTSTSVERTVSE